MNKSLFALFIFFLFSSCQEEKKNFSSLPNFVPPETAIVLKTDDLRDFSKRLANNSFFSQVELSAQKKLQQKLEVLDFVDTGEESLLCFSMIGRDVFYTFITKNKSNLIPTDSLPNKMVESFQYGEKTVKKYTLEGNVLYSVVLNGVFVGSGSKLIVENVIRLFNLGLEQNVHFKEIYASASGNASLFVQNKNFRKFYGHFFPKGNPSFLKHFSGWTALDLEVEKNAIFLNGIVMEKAAAPTTLDFFKGVEPQENQLAQVVPLNATGFYAFTFHDFSVLRKNILQKNNTELPEKLEGLFASANEIGSIYFPEGNAVVLNSKNVEQTKTALLSQLEIADEFRGQAIYNFTEKNIFHQAFSPLLNSRELNFYTRLDHFFVFAEKMEVLQNIIANFQNKSVLANQDYFKETAENLSGEASILLVGINENLKKHLAGKVAEKHQEEIKNLDLHGYQLSAMQFVRGDGFSHVNVTFQKNTGETAQNGTAQLMALQLENPLVGNPQFFEYWRTGEQYIVAQDEKNTLYLFDTDGELRWKKQLDGRILGEIQPVDLFKNTRLQMAFATPDKFYVIDRNGKDVAPFPVEFDAPITQPLSVFDYAGNRDYRFVIVQNKTVSMLDSKAESVNGFEFEVAKSSILQAPKHIRIGWKDYILIPEKSGKLNILSRQGKPRVSVEKKLDFSDNEWFLLRKKFTSTNAKGNLMQIDESGAISTEDLELSETHKIAVLGTTLVSLSENILTINEKELELDYGLYTAPKIFNIGDKTYVNITDTQASKVYLFNGKGKLLPGFPVYGNSTIDLGNLDNEGKLEFVAKGEDDSVLVYRVD